MTTDQDLRAMQNEAKLIVALTEERLTNQRLRDHIASRVASGELDELTVAFEKSRRNHPSGRAR